MRSNPASTLATTKARSSQQRVLRLVDVEATSSRLSKNAQPAKNYLAKPVMKLRAVPGPGIIRQKRHLYPFQIL